MGYKVRLVVALFAASLIPLEPPCATDTQKMRKHC